MLSTSSLKKQIPISIAALVMVGVVGFIAGQKFGPKSAAENPSGTKRALVGSRAVSLPSSDRSRKRTEGRSTSVRIKSAKEAMGLRIRSHRFRALEDYYAGLGASQFEEELEKLRELHESDRLMAARLLFTNWGEIDPTAAIAHTKTMGFEGTFLFENVMRSWAAKYPQDAAAYYRANAKDYRIGGMNANRTSKILEITAEEWARQDNTAAMAWAQSLEGDDQRNAMCGIFSHAAKKDPAAAADLAMKIDSETTRAASIGEIVASWVVQNEEEAYVFVEKQPEGKVRDSAVISYIMKNQSEDPQKNLKLAETIGNEFWRERLIEEAVAKWAKKDKQAAMQYVEDRGSQ